MGRLGNAWLIERLGDNASLRASGLGLMLAAVYVSFVVSPPLIGWVAEFGSLQVALAILGISGAATVWLTTMCVLTMREVPE